MSSRAERDGVGDVAVDCTRLDPNIISRCLHWKTNRLLQASRRSVGRRTNGNNRENVRFGKYEAHNDFMHVPTVRNLSVRSDVSELTKDEFAATNMEKTLSDFRLQVAATTSLTFNFQKLSTTSLVKRLTLFQSHKCAKVCRNFERSGEWRSGIADLNESLGIVTCKGRDGWHSLLHEQGLQRTKDDGLTNDMTQQGTRQEGHWNEMQ